MTTVRVRGRAPAVALVGAALWVSACASMGPETVGPDQFDYGQALTQASTEQLLMNMVRLRYDEPPTFLTVSSVISQYRRAANASLGAGLNTATTGQDTGSVGIGGSWADRPTITYTPVAGREFTRTLLTPLPASALFGLLQSGTPADLVVRLALVSLNGIQNESARPSHRRPADPAFFELMDLLRSLRDARAIGTQQSAKDQQVVFVLRSQNLTPEIQAQQARLRQLLFLEPGRSEFHLVDGLIPRAPDEIAVLTRSLRDIMLDLAWQFDVPPEHVADGRTEESFAGPLGPPIRVHVSSSRPADAFVAVASRGHWYYVEDRDRASKRAFSFLHMLLSLTERPEPGLTPVLSIN